MVKSSIQIRANMLTRELHALEESEHLVRLLGERQAVRQALAESQDGNTKAVGKAAAKKKNGKKQTALDNFFKKPSAGSKKSSKVSDVIILSDDDDKDDDPVVQKKQKSKENSKNMEDAVSGDKRAESGLPKDACSPSPEKKLRVA